MGFKSIINLCKCKDMKRLIGWAMLLIVLAACSKDESGENLDVQSLVGTWTWESMETGGVDIPLSSVGMSLNMTFMSSGSWTAHAAGLPVAFGSGTYSVSGNNLIIHELGDTYNWEIKSMNNTTMVVNWSEYGFKMKFVKN